MLGILCGLESEAKIARRIGGAIVVCAAARPHKARDLARELVAQGATRLMSFGIAGSLDDSAHVGDVFIGTSVRSETGAWDCDEAWGRALATRMPQAKRGAVYGSEILVATVAEKQILFQKTGCAIVDMESQCLAEIAAAARIPFAVIRTVCDDAHMNVPPLVMAAIAEDGGVDIVTAVTSLVRHPSQIPALFHVMRGTGKALGLLRRVVAEIE